MRIVCAILGHKWRTYFYPHGDDWFGNPHDRRACARCGADEVREATPGR